MVEVVFSDSACGSLKTAQSYGLTPYDDGCIAVVPADDERLRKAREDARRDWEKAAPMGGKASDVYGLHFLLSMGDIREEIPGEKRLAWIKNLYSIYPMGVEAACELWENSLKDYRAVLKRVQQNENVRIWYSDQPDEACGYCWLLTLLERMDYRGEIYAVKLPEWEEKDGCMIEKSSWADASPGEWGQYVSLQNRVLLPEMKRAAQVWHGLQKDNAPLRLVMNGKLRSAAANIYDSFILWEIQQQPMVFHQARLIGSVLGKYNLGIGDEWIAQRMEQMLQEGVLEVVTEAPENSPLYHRILRKAALPEAGQL